MRLSTTLGFFYTCALYRCQSTVCTGRQKRYEQVASIMSRNQFEYMKNFLHFADKSNAPDPSDPNSDNLYNIRELFEKLRHNCLKASQKRKMSVMNKLYHSREGAVLGSICQKRQRTGQEHPQQGSCKMMYMTDRPRCSKCGDEMGATNIVSDFVSQLPDIGTKTSIQISK